MEEDRNCSCQNNDNMNMQINMNIPVINNSCGYDINDMTREEMLNEIKCLKFAVSWHRLQICEPSTNNHLSLIDV